MKKHTNLMLGFTFTGIGIAGAFVPVLPSTCFFIAAAYFFSLSSERMENWLLNHKLFGAAVLQWRQNRAIPKLGKIMASASMVVSAALLMYSPLLMIAKLCGLALLAACLWYVNSRPTAA